MMADEIDYYALLEVHPTASQEMISRAYRLHASRRHPDVQPEGERAAAEEFMRVLNAAYSVLSDPTRRAEYDRTNGRPALAAEGRGSVQRAERRGADVANTALCANHPGRPRAAACVGCRQSLCQDCLVDVAGMPYCRECVPHAPRGAAPRLAPHVAPPTGPIARLARMKLPSVDLAGVSGLITVLAILALMAGAVWSGFIYYKSIYAQLSNVVEAIDAPKVVPPAPPAVKPTGGPNGQGTVPGGPPTGSDSKSPPGQSGPGAGPTNGPQGPSPAPGSGPVPNVDPEQERKAEQGKIRNAAVTVRTSLKDTPTPQNWDAAFKELTWELLEADKYEFQKLINVLDSWCKKNHDGPRSRKLNGARGLFPGTAGAAPSPGEGIDGGQQ
jgi:hypothetical protein